MTEQNWEHFAFSRGLTLRVLDYLRCLDSRTALPNCIDTQLNDDIKELEGALAEPKC